VVIGDRIPQRNYRSFEGRYRREMGPRFSTLYDSGVHGRQSPTASDAAEVSPSAVQLESKQPGCEGSRHGWTSAPRKHVALLETIRGKTSRSRRVPVKPTVSIGVPSAAAASSTATDKRVWAKLIARLSRKMSSTRLASSRQQQLAETGVELHHGTGAAGLIRGTSSVLPVNRNPVTTTVAYNDNSKHRLNDNNNIASADFASRVINTNVIL